MSNEQGRTQYPREGAAMMLDLPAPEDVVVYAGVGALLAYWIFMIFIRPFV